MNKFFHFTPRIISILFVLFILMFSFDVFGEGYSFWETVLAFVMHNIPVFIIGAGLAIFWKNSRVLGYVFVIVAVIFMVVMLNMNDSDIGTMILSVVTIPGSAVVVAVLYFMDARGNSTATEKTNPPE